MEGRFEDENFVSGLVENIYSICLTSAIICFRHYRNAVKQKLLYCICFSYSE